MEVIIKNTYEDISKLAAEFIANIVRKKPRCVLGLATGSTPIGTYKDLIRMHKNEGLDFSQVISFNLDEYVGITSDDPNSYRYFMNDNLFNHINIRKENTFIPDGMTKDPVQFSIDYEKKIKEYGGIDIQVLGIGSNGHIAFNEPGSSLGSRTRIKTLTHQTRKDNARFYHDNIDDVPLYAITMGVGTILEAQKLLLLANTKNKSQAIMQAIEGPITAQCPASVIQMHRNAIVIIDKESSSQLKNEYPHEPSSLKFLMDS